MINHKIKFIIIVPEQPPFTLPTTGVSLDRLRDRLTNRLRLSGTGDYTKLYRKGRLVNRRVFNLFKSRGGLQKASRRAFPALADPDGLIDGIQRRLRIRRDLQQERFKLRPEHPARTRHTLAQATITSIIDDQRPPPGATEATKATIRFLTGRSGQVGNTFLQNNRRQDRQLTNPWLNKGLPNNLRKLAQIAVFGENGKGKGIIFHEPHHDLSPGMLLIDEIFSALTSRVADLVEGINAETERTNGQKPDLTPLIDFVNELSNVDGKSNEFTSFILPGGLRPDGRPHTVNGVPVHIDPTRVELLIEGGWIYAAPVFVGAWKGGTHSNGSVH
jgi:hypothetical protein